MFWFGWSEEDPHRPPATQDRQLHAPTPTGDWCISCNQQVVDGDRGFLVPGNGEFQTNQLEPIHYTCVLQELLGPQYADLVEKKEAATA